MATRTGSRQNGNGRSSQTGPAASIVTPLTSRDPRMLTGRQVSHLDPFSEIGTTGLKQYGGFVLEEWLSKLQGKRAAWVWREMADNSAVIGGIMYAIRMLSRKVEWRVESDDDTVIPRAGMTGPQFVESCQHDMNHTWGDFVSEALSFLQYGWSMHEEVLKKRDGQLPTRAPLVSEGDTPETQEDDSPASSKYDDGLIGWRKLPIRAQETLLRWRFRGYSGLLAMEQVDWHGGVHVIPIEKALLFRTEASRGNPEGRSILRSAFQAYYYMQTIQTDEAIGISRDLAGIPKATAPEGVDIFAPQHKEVLEVVKQLVTSIEKDEQQGIVMPTGWELDLMKSGGARQVDTDTVIRRYRQEIAASVLADFILVGLDDIGSYAMVDVKAELFGVAVDAVLDMLCEVMNRYAIPRLFRANGFTGVALPRIAHSSAGRIDLEKVANFFYNLAGAGAPIPWSSELIEQLFAEAGLPATFHGEAAEEIHKAETLTQNVVHCARCGEDHKALSFTSLTRPVEQDGGEPLTHVAICPNNGQPILLGHTPDPLSKSAPDGVVDLAPQLADRARVLSMQLEGEIAGALKHLGGEAATAYLRVAQKAAKPDVRAIVRAVMASLDVKGWVERRLKPLLSNHAARVAGDTQRIVQTEVQGETQVAEKDVQRMQAQAGGKLRARDIEPQIRAAIMQAVKEGLAVGDNPAKTATRIKDMVPSGRFVKAGSQYRSRLIARDQTGQMQRAATASAYKSNANITAVRVRDGIFGPPRSDSVCLARDGDIVPIDEVDKVLPNHPQCSLSLDPVVSADAAVPQPVAV